MLDTQRRPAVGMDGRTPAPRRLPSPLPGTHDENATVVEDFVLHYGGGGPTTVRAGERGRVEDVDDVGLCRFSSGAARRALCDASHFLLDEDRPA